MITYRQLAFFDDPTTEWFRQPLTRAAMRVVDADPEQRLRARPARSHDLITGTRGVVLLDALDRDETHAMRVVASLFTLGQTDDAGKTVYHVTWHHGGPQHATLDVEPNNLAELVLLSLPPAESLTAARAPTP